MYIFVRTVPCSYFNKTTIKNVYGDAIFLYSYNENLDNEPGFKGTNI